MKRVTLLRHIAASLAAWIAVTIYTYLGIGEPDEEVVGRLTTIIETSFLFVALVVYALVEKLTKRFTKE